MHAWKHKYILYIWQNIYNCISTMEDGWGVITRVLSLLIMPPSHEIFKQIELHLVGHICFEIQPCLQTPQPHYSFITPRRSINMGLLCIEQMCWMLHSVLQLRDTKTPNLRENQIKNENKQEAVKLIHSVNDTQYVISHTCDRLGLMTLLLLVITCRPHCRALHLCAMMSLHLLSLP